MQKEHSQWYIVQHSHFLIARHSVCNSLQFFQWLVMLQCSGQSYSSSVSQIIAFEAVVGTTRHKHLTRKFSVFCCHGNDNFSSPEHWYCARWLDNWHWCCHSNRTWLCHITGIENWFVDFSGVKDACHRPCSVETMSRKRWKHSALCLPKLFAHLSIPGKHYCMWMM